MVEKQKQQEIAAGNLFSLLWKCMAFPYRKFEKFRKIMEANHP